MTDPTPNQLIPPVVASQPSHGDTQHGDTQHGDTQHGEAQRGEAPHGQAPHGSFVESLIEDLADQNRSSEVGSGIDLVAFVAAVPLAAAVYIVALPFRGTYAGQLLSGRIPPIIVYFSLVAMVALLLKFLGYRRQFSALRHDLLPAQLGRRIHSRNANQFSHYLTKVRVSKRNLLVGRLKRGLAFLATGRSAKEVSEFLEQQSQIDTQKIAASYSYISLIVWALPILGFIGTVLGIGSAVSEFSGAVNAAEDMTIVKHSLTGVTSGLGVSFNTTLLALVMSMFVMFPMKFVQKREEALLTAIDSFVQNNFCRRLHSDASVSPQPNSNDSLGEALDALRNLFASTIEQLQRNMTHQVTNAINAAAKNTDALGRTMVKEIRDTFSIPNGTYERFCQEVQELEEKRALTLTRLIDQNSQSLNQIEQSYQTVLPAFEHNSQAIRDLVSSQQQCVRELEPQLTQITHLVDGFAAAVAHASKRQQQINSVDLSDRSQKVLEFIYRSSRRNEELQKIQYHELNRLANSGLLPQLKASLTPLIGKVRKSLTGGVPYQTQMEVANVQSQKA